MRFYMGDPKVRAVVWETALGVEVVLEKECVGIGFVEVARVVRLE